MTTEDEQRLVCAKHCVLYQPVSELLMLGISKTFDATSYPINGLRHPPQHNTCGWYLWSGGEPSQAADFFVSMHVSHLGSVCEPALKFLGLPPGWRFLIAPGVEDVWFDPAILEV